MSRVDRNRKPYSRPTAAERTRAPEGTWLHDKAPPLGPSARGPGANARVPTGPAGPSTKLVVSNLHYEIMPKDLSSIFGQIGTLVREPLIKYDRSGRSSGVAIIAFETSGEATRAKNQFDGILAKGQPMTIAYDTTPIPRAPRRHASAPTSLLDRIQKPPLLDRLGKDAALPTGPAAGKKGAAPPTKPRGKSASAGSGPGPVRTVKAPRAPRQPKKPKTAAELDNELDAFMGDSEPGAGAAEAASAPAAEVAGGEGDVDMA